MTPPLDLTGLTLVGSRRRPQAPPPHVVHAALCDPTTTNRPWLHLHSGEVAPEVVEVEAPTRVVWASLWPQDPDDLVELVVGPGDREGAGSVLEWRLWSRLPADHPRVRPRCRRLQELLNRDLRNDHLDG